MSLPSCHFLWLLMVLGGMVLKGWLKGGGVGLGLQSGAWLVPMSSHLTSCHVIFSSYLIALPLIYGNFLTPAVRVLFLFI